MRTTSQTNSRLKMMNRVGLLKQTLSHSFNLLILKLPNLRSAIISENWKTICSTFFRKHITIHRKHFRITRTPPNKVVKWDVNISQKMYGNHHIHYILFFFLYLQIIHLLFAFYNLYFSNYRLQLVVVDHNILFNV